MLYTADTHNVKGEHLAFNQTSIFIQNAGGFGGRRASDKSIAPVSAPQRPPDVSVQEKTSVDQVDNSAVTSCLHHIWHSEYYGANLFFVLI